jgi:hypothetical protein
VIDGLIAANAPDDVIEHARAQCKGSNAEDCEIWPENVEAVNLFLSLGTQWLTNAMGHPQGISYLAIDALMAILAIPKKRRPELFADLQIMESAALNYINRDKK